MNQQTPENKNRSTTWRFLYFVGGMAAVITVLVFRRYFSVELMQFNGFGLFTVPDTWPSGAAEWFAIFQENRFVALVLFDLFDLINYGLVGLIFLALYGALKEASRKAMLAAGSIMIAAVAIQFASNKVLSMNGLSGRFANASTDAEQAELLQAGDALLTIHNPGTLYPGNGIFLSLFLLLLAGLIISVVMLRSQIFNKATAVAGILANGIALGFFFALALIPDYTWIFPSFSAPFRMIWYILIAVKLFQLALAKKPITKSEVSI